MKVCLVLLEDDVEEEDCPDKDENWEDDQSHLDKVLSLISSPLKIFDARLPAPASRPGVRISVFSGTGEKALIYLSNTSKNESAMIKRGRMGRIPQRR